MMRHTDEKRPLDHPTPGSAARSWWRPLMWISVAWILAGTAAGVRLHVDGGVFGEAVALGPSVAGALLRALPWWGAALVAWWLSGRRPLPRGDLLPALTLHLAAGFAVVVGQQVALAALQSTLIPAELTPPDPWSRLQLELVRRGPMALGLYLVILAGMMWIRSHGAFGGGETRDPGSRHRSADE
jgi:hypothetical protein